MDDLAIRPATWRDFRAVYALEKLCFGREAWSSLDVLSALSFPETVRLLAECNEEVVGFIVGDIRRKEGLGWIATIGVHPDFRRKGIGMRLLEACEQALGTPRVKLTLRVSNRGALSLYHQAGYKQVDSWEKYYRSGEDGLVMEKKMR